MAEPFCRARRCGRMSLVVVVSRVGRRRRARIVVIAIVVDGKSVVAVGGIGGVGAMRAGDVVANVLMRLGPMRPGLMLCRRSSMRSRVG